MTALRVATLNLYQFAEPGTFWYDARDGNRNTQEVWEAKLAFLRDLLAQADADVIALQEVFSAGPLVALLDGLGYAVHLPPSLPEPVRGDDGALVYPGPCCAIASRLPFAATGTVPPAPQAEPGGLLAADAAFRRTVLEAAVEVPGLPGPVTVIACHLKSRGAFVDGDEIAALPTWDLRWREHLRRRAAADASQLIRRTAEALFLRARVDALLDAGENRPVLVMGDLNDTPDTTTLDVITQDEPVDVIARRSARFLDPAEKVHRYHRMMRDAGAVASRRARRPTHYHWRHGGSVLDYVLHSDAFAEGNAARLGRVADVDVIDAHLVGPEAGNDARRASDHAMVVAEIALEEGT